MNIGKWVKQYREVNNISQEKFGKIVGVNKQTVSRWEKGTLQPSTNMYFLISKAINIPLEDILDETNNNKTSLPVYKINKTYEVGLNSVFSAMNDYDTLISFLDMIDQMNFFLENAFPIAFLVM